MGRLYRWRARPQEPHVLLCFSGKFSGAAGIHAGTADHSHASFLRGDLSQWTTPIYDPTTTISDGKGGFTRTAFAGNQIPASRISSISAKIAALYPSPLFPNQISGNYIGPLTSPMQDDHNFSVKMDHLFTSRHRAFGTFLFTDRPAIKGVAAGITGPAEDHNRQDLNSRFLRIGEDWTISPTLINHFVASFDRVVDTNRTLSLGRIQGRVFIAHVHNFWTRRHSPLANLSAASNTASRPIATSLFVLAAFTSGTTPVPTNSVPSGNRSHFVHTRATAP